MSLISTDLAWDGKDEYEDDDLLRFFLVGADRKTRWWFGGPGSPVRLNVPPTGLQGAPFTHDWQKITGMDGAVHKGTTDEQATITLQVWVSDPRSSTWARRQHSLWRESLGRGRETCRLFAISKESGYWWIDVRVDSISEVNYFEQMPGHVGEIGELVTFVSDRSFWQKFDEVKLFTRETAPKAHMLNMGDQPAWLKWAVTGEHSGCYIGVGDERLLLPDPRRVKAKYLNYKVEGFWVDTDELWPSFLSSAGEDLQPLYPDHYWKTPLPPRGVNRDAVTPLVIRPINPGPSFRCQVSYTPRSEQAW
jgi:hypothetical protein